MSHVYRYDRRLAHTRTPFRTRNLIIVLPLITAILTGSLITMHASRTDTTGRTPTSQITAPKAASQASGKRIPNETVLQSQTHLQALPGTPTNQSATTHPSTIKQRASSPSSDKSEQPKPSSCSTSARKALPIFWFTKDNTKNSC